MDAIQRQSNPGDMSSLYPNILKLIECLRHRLLEVVKHEFKHHPSFTDIGWTQALLIYDIQDSNVTIAELCSREPSLGDNLLYNIKKLLRLGYIYRQPAHEHRVVLALTEKGQNVCQVMTCLYDRHLQSMEYVGGVTPMDLLLVNKTLSRLDHFLSHQVRYCL